MPGVANKEFPLVEFWQQRLCPSLLLEDAKLKLLLCGYFSMQAGMDQKQLKKHCPVGFMQQDLRNRSCATLMCTTSEPYLVMVWWGKPLSWWYNQFLAAIPGSAIWTKKDAVKSKSSHLYLLWWRISLCFLSCSAALMMSNCGSCRRHGREPSLCFVPFMISLSVEVFGSHLYFGNHSEDYLEQWWALELTFLKQTIFCLEPSNCSILGVTCL